MGAVNTGNQKITFKYSTPLQADYLNIMLHGMSTPGLMTRPKFVWSSAGSSVTVEVHPFSMLVHPLDDTLAEEDEEGNYITTKMVKISVMEAYKLPLTRASVAIGFKYSFTNEGTLLSQWYGEFKVLDINDAANFDGIVIGTVQSYESPDTRVHYSVTTNGADISDFLLLSEGWDSKHWLSLVSPRRLNKEQPGYNHLELRSHNDLWAGYVNGSQGTVSQRELTVDYTSDGVMTDDFYLVKHTSSGLNFCQHSNEFPIRHTDGGVFAVCSFEVPNTKEFAKMFANLVKIKPCLQEQRNFYIDNGTLFVR